MFPYHLLFNDYSCQTILITGKLIIFSYLNMKKFYMVAVPMYLYDYRVFVLLVAMGQKSLAGPCAVTILESLLDMLAKVLSPVVNGQPAANQTGL